MRRLGILGGMSWESSALYYRQLNEGVRVRRGSLASAPLLLWSAEFSSIAAAQAAGEWDELGVELGEAGAGLRKAGAEALLIASNTMHCLVQSIEARSGLPVLHIADATGRALQDKGCRTPLLLGTRFTMEQDFYRRRLQTQFGLEVVCPDEAGRARVHQVIYDELCQGVILDESRDALRQIIAQTLPQGVDSVILGCTELGMILSPCDELPPLFDTTALHVGMALDWMTLA